MTFCAEAIRPLFPALHVPAEDRTQPIFLDNPAGTQVPQSVIDAVRDYYLTMNANSGGAFATSQRNDAMVAQTRQAVADFLNAPSPDEIVIGANMTTLCFALSRSIAQTLAPGDEIVLTRMDHDANVAPWTLIARDNGLVVKWVEIHADDCTLDMASLKAALSEKTRVVATVHASNAVGTINPIAQIADMAHAVGAWHVVDAVQSAPHTPIDVRALGCDFLLCSSYKFYGPHLGIMWGHEELLNTLPVYKVRPSKDSAPWRWETGTASYETWNGLLACMEHWAMLGREYGGGKADACRATQVKRGILAAQAYERDLVTRLVDGLLAIKGVTVAGIRDSARFDWRVPTVSMVKRGISPDETAERLAKEHVHVWSGDYYAHELMQALGRPQGMVRIGIGQYNTQSEIDRLLELVEAL